MILRLMPMDNFWYIDLMRLLFVADGRSPIAQNWIRYFVERGHEVHLASTFACSPPFPLASITIVPVAWSGSLKSAGRARRTLLSPGIRSAIRHWIGPFTIHRSSARLRGLTQQIKPDLVHALRIPYEGMLAADAYTGIPLALSVWGNDFTLHAASNGMMAHYTSWAMQVADALHADCQRDIRLGRKWGFVAERPTLVTPGNGGIRTAIFHPVDEPVTEPIVLNPRGLRTYVRNDTFFRAIPLVLARRPDARFLCVAMAGEPEAQSWTRKLGVEQSVELFAAVPYGQMGDIFRRAQVAVSLGAHDGTPNTLLEGMACGCFPIAGDLESIREWIEPERNGYLVDPGDPDSLAEAILKALENKGLRQEAASLNHRIILERAEYERCMAAAAQYYQRIVSAP